MKILKSSLIVISMLLTSAAMVSCASGSTAAVNASVEEIVSCVPVIEEINFFTFTDLLDDSGDESDDSDYPYGYQYEPSPEEIDRAMLDFAVGNMERQAMEDQYRDFRNYGFY